MSTNTYDPDAAIVADTWEIARDFIVDPCADDAPVADRLRAVRLAVQRAKAERGQYGNLPPAQARLVATWDESLRRARPILKPTPAKGAPPIFMARFMTAISATLADVARMTDAEAVAKDAVLSEPRFTKARLALLDLQHEFVDGLRAEIDTIPHEHLEQIIPEPAVRAAEREAEIRGDVPLVLDHLDQHAPVPVATAGSPS